MTDPNYTHITVLLDESGSMERLADDTRGGFNSFLTEQKALDGKATISVYKFADTYKVLYSMQSIKKAKALNSANYAPVGNTALLDAMGKSISDLGKDLADLPEEKRPGKVLFLVITDGQENHSREWSKAKIAEAVKHQEAIYKWNFLYLGANVDAFHEAAGMGMRTSNSIGYKATSRGVHDAYLVMNASVGAVRTSSLQDAQYDVFNGTKDVSDLQGADFASSILVNGQGTAPVTPPESAPASKP